LKTQKNTTFMEQNNRKGIYNQPDETHFFPENTNLTG
jgi:hypothetical protein